MRSSRSNCSNRASCSSGSIIVTVRETACAENSNQIVRESPGISQQQAIQFCLYTERDTPPYTASIVAILRPRKYEKAGAPAIASVQKCENCGCEHEEIVVRIDRRLASSPRDHSASPGERNCAIVVGQPALSTLMSPSVMSAVVWKRV